MEKPLNVWIEDQVMKIDVLSVLIIWGKTKNHCEYFVSCLGYVSDAAAHEASEDKFEK
jgi:hypothetical protein